MDHREQYHAKGMRLSPDLLLLAALLAAGGLLFAGFLLTGDRGTVVRVSVDGELFQTYPLERDGTYEIRGASDAYNLLVIESGTARIKEASCPDRLCIRMGRISRSGQSVVCLPNRVVITIESERKDGVDAAVQ